MASERWHRGRVLAMASLLLSLSRPLAAADPPGLQILWDRPLPAGAAGAIDVRWASDDSVYLALGRGGVVEMSLEPFGGRIVEIVPGASRAGGFFVSTLLAASGQDLLVGAPIAAVTWRTRSNAVRKEAAFDAVEDLDLHDGKVLILGARRDEEGRFAPEGGIAWLGTLAAELRDARPVVFDSRGAGAPNLNACGNFGLGAVRFLVDGSFVVAPGVQPGVLHFDPKGRLLRTWDTLVLGLTGDCARMTFEESRRVHFTPARWEWLAARRTLDEIVQLDERIGLVLRQSVNGRPSWELAVLPLGGGPVGREPIAIEPLNEITHLQADLRNGRLAILVRAYVAVPGTTSSMPGRLVLAKLDPNRSSGAGMQGPAPVPRRGP